MKNQVINFIKIKMLRLTLELQKSDASVCVCVFIPLASCTPVRAPTAAAVSPANTICPPP